MPRRLPVRPAKVLGNFFVLIALSMMVFIYYTNVFVVWVPKAQDDSRVIGLLIVYNFIFFMLVWSFLQTMTTDPGQVPVFWGFHLGDNENKRRRYCLMCNVFKPERCHHCSACNRCVLNMDHHCPWVNNCVGFWNRKYFLLLLIYVLIGTYVGFFMMVYDFYNAVKWGFDNKFIGKSDPNLFKNVIIMIAFIFNFMVSVLITGFLKFHCMLASGNKTTIENLDKLGRPFDSPYDIGDTANWRQIFGTNACLWPFPIFCGSGKPIGDGIYWPTPQSMAELTKKQNETDQLLVVSPLQNLPGSQSKTSATSNTVQSRMQSTVQNPNVLKMNNNQPNVRNDINQQMFQNQGRAQQLQQQLQQQNQSPAQSQYGPAGGNNAVQSQGSSGQVMQKKKRGPGPPPNQGYGTHQAPRSQNNFRR